MKWWKKISTECLNSQWRQHDTHQKFSYHGSRQQWTFSTLRTKKHWRQTNERPCSVYVGLSNVKRIQHKNMLVVLCQRDYVSFWCNLQAATAAHLHIWTLKLANKCRITLEHGNVKPISMTVTDKYVTCITDVDPIGVVGEVLTTNAAQKLSLLTEDDDTVPLHNNNNDLQA